VAANRTRLARTHVIRIARALVCDGRGRGGPAKSSRPASMLAELGEECSTVNSGSNVSEPARAARRKQPPEQGMCRPHNNAISTFRARKSRNLAGPFPRAVLSAGATRGYPSGLSISIFLAAAPWPAGFRGTWSTSR
jgi:hypothetical protein